MHKLQMHQSSLLSQSLSLLNELTGSTCVELPIKFDRFGELIKKQADEIRENSQKLSEKSKSVAVICIDADDEDQLFVISEDWPHV